jgi:hypothetical protein
VILRDGFPVRDEALSENDCDQEGHFTELKARFWDMVVENSGYQDWLAGCFGYTEHAQSEHFESGERLNWQAAGVEFFWPEIEESLGKRGVGVPQDIFVRPDLPGKLTPNDRKHAEFAHRAAELIRSGGNSPAKAFELALGEATEEWKKQFSREPESAEQAVRRIFRKMYDRRGHPVRDPVRKSQD